MTLDEFIAEIQAKPEKFREMWLKNREQDPDSWPLEFEKGNSGLWYEQFVDYLLNQD